MSQSWFPALSRRLAGIAGSGFAFAVALGVVIVWVVTGPLFGFSDEWQLTINTGTTIVTFLMVFLIQNTQNRDTEAMQIKLDEIIRATSGAHNALLNMEEASDEEPAAYHKQFADLAAYAKTKLKAGGSDEDVPVLRDSSA